jgi:hypothetical protein
MTRQETLEQIQYQLRILDDDALESVLAFIEGMEPKDAWDEQIAADSRAGKFDALIEDIKKDYYQGKVIPLEDSFSDD